jgi:hypothetical protein
MSTNTNNNRAMFSSLESRRMFSVAFDAALDFNHDGQLTGDDMAIVDSGDLNQDGAVTGDDASVLDAAGGIEGLTTRFISARAMQVRVENDPFADFDLNHDGFHTGDDYAILDSGDLNGDGEVTGDDASILDYLGGSEHAASQLSEAMHRDELIITSYAFADVDFNHDGVITDIDQAVAATGDYNLDGCVTGDDESVVDSCGGKSGVAARLESALLNQKFLDVDFNHDGQITAEDYAVADSGDYNLDGEVTGDDAAISDYLGGSEGVYARLNEATSAVK